LTYSSIIDSNFKDAFISKTLFGEATVDGTKFNSVVLLLLKGAVNGK
jgi:hypothetical protein